MAKTIGKITFENGSFFIKHPDGTLEVAKVGATLSEGDVIIGSSSNNNSNLIRVSLIDNSSEIQVVGSNEQLFDITLLSGEIPEDTVVQNSEVGDLLEQATNNQQDANQNGDQATLTLAQIENLDAAAAGGDQTTTTDAGIVPLRLEDRTAGETNITTDLRDAEVVNTVIDDTVIANDIVTVNNAPTVSATASTGFTEAADASAQDLSDSGTVSFGDIDTNDVVDISYASNGDIAWSGGIIDPSLAAQLVAGFSVTTVINAAAPGTTPWTYSVTGANLDFLNQGETITFSYIVTATDDAGATATTPVIFTITGTNDAPTVSATAASAITEAADASAQDLSDSGTVSFGDIDTNDVVDISYASNGDIAWSGGTIDSALAAQLVAGFSVTTVTDAAAPGTTPWTYSVTGANLDFLSQGETITFSYTVTATDDAGEIDTTQVSFIITGTNDVPTITASGTDATGAVTEIADLASNELTATLSDSGTITFADLDSTDTHNATVALTSVTGAPSALGTLTLSDNTANTDGTIGWTFEVADSAVDYMREGDTITQVYTVTISDGNTGGTVTQDITVTITGTNDAPILTVDATGSVTENDTLTTLTDSGTLSFTDVDTADTHTISKSYNDDMSWDGGTLTTAQIDTIKAGFTADSDSWDYSVANSAVDFLADGETITFSYDVTVTDDSGATNNSDTETVTITITGTNDVPTITASGTDATGAVTEIADLASNELTATLSDSGTITFADLDSTDTHNATVALTSVTGAPSALGTLTLSDNTANTDGTIGWTFEVADSAVDYMREGDTITQVYTVTISDGNTGGTVTQDITVTITGTNDAPILTVDATGSVTENDTLTTLTDSGTLSFTDVDTADTHTISKSYNDDMSWDGGTLTTAQIDTIKAGFTADSDSWDYSVANSAVDFLADGETITFSYDVTVTDDSGATNNSDTETVTITITGTNDVPSLVVTSGDTGIVYEAGLSDGSGIGSTTITSTGTFTIADADGLDDITHVKIGSTEVAIADLFGTIITTGHSTLEITAYNSTTGVASFIYTLTDNVTDVANQVEQDVFSLSVSDNGGTSYSSTDDITITIVDDVPTISYVSSEVTTNDSTNGDFSSTWSYDVGADNNNGLPSNITISLDNAVELGITTTTTIFNGTNTTLTAKDVGGNDYFTITVNTDGTYDFNLVSTQPTKYETEDTALTGINGGNTTVRYLSDFVSNPSVDIAFTTHSTYTTVTNLGVTTYTLSGGNKVNTNANGIGAQSGGITIQHGESVSLSFLASDKITIKPIDTVTVSFVDQSGNSLSVNNVTVIVHYSGGGISTIENVSGTSYTVAIDPTKKINSIDIVNVNSDNQFLISNVTTGFITNTITPDDVNLDFTIDITDTDGDSDSYSFGIGIDAQGSVTGTIGDDAILGTNTVDTITGNNGDDIIDGGAGDDIIDGGAGDDIIDGGIGNDTINGGLGADSINGGTGNDTIVFDSNDTLIDGGADFDTLRLINGDDIDFSALDNALIKNIEKIDLATDTQANELTKLSLSDVMAMTPEEAGITDLSTGITSTDHLLKITGGTNDLVNLIDSGDSGTSDNWVKSNNTYTDTTDSTVYDVFTNNEDSSYKVLIQTTVQDTITNS